MPENSVESMRQEYQKRFPNFNWTSPRPANELPGHINNAMFRANLAMPMPGSMESMFALAFRCSNYETIGLDQVLETRLLAWGSKVALNGERIMELEETFDQRQQDAIKSVLSLKRSGSDRYKNMTEAEVIKEATGGFLKTHIEFLNHYCKEIDSGERNLAGIVFTYLPPEDPWHGYFDR